MSVPSRHFEIKSREILKQLRHHLEEFKTATSDGYVDIDELISKTNIKVELLNMIESQHKRKPIKIDGNRVRANDGYTSRNINEDEMFERILTPLNDCYHATDKRLLCEIKSRGLQVDNRKHIHFSRNKYLLRKKNILVVEINMEAAMLAGIKFYFNDKGVIITPGINSVIPPEFLTFHMKPNKSKFY